MSVFDGALKAFNSADFEAQFKMAAQSLDIEQLKLQQALQKGSAVLPSPPTLMIISSHQDKYMLIVRSGIFFRSIIAGCNCADDPTPVDSLEEYVEATFEISRKDGSFRIQFDS